MNLISGNENMYHKTEECVIQNIIPCESLSVIVFLFIFIHTKADKVIQTSNNFDRCHRCDHYTNI